MINKENSDKEQTNPKKKTEFVDIARMDVQAHLLIKDKDTSEVLVNKRG
jgi:hypothetical protein